MEEGDPTKQFYVSNTSYVRELEEKIRLLKDRTLLIGQSFIEERDKTISDLREIKKSIEEIKQENERMKVWIMNASEQLSKLAKKEDLLILQRQFDLFRS